MWFKSVVVCEKHELSLSVTEWSRRGLPCILIHGLGDAGCVWDHLAVRLAPHFRVVAMDLRGHGNSEWDPEVRYDATTFTADLTKIVNSYGFDRMVLVAHSLGADVAIRYTAENAPRVVGLVIVDFGPELDKSGIDELLRNFRAVPRTFGTVEKYWEWLTARRPLANPKLLRQFARYNLRRSATQTWELKSDPQLTSGSKMPGFEVVNDHYVNPKLWPSLMQIKCPTLVVRGMASGILPYKVANRMVEGALTNGRLATIATAGHSVMFDNPVEFSAKISSFLGELPERPVRSIKRASKAKMIANQEPIRFVTDERLDLNHFKPLRKSYIVASSYRSGSQYLCWMLWQTGRLGTPTEILNPANELRVLMNRFKVSSPSDYIAKLVAHRTTRNGVFSMKAHFHHFEAFLKEYPALLDALSPVSFIYITRHDKVAQAVSMAKALQTGWWTSRMEQGLKPPLHYDRQMIANCLEEIEQQDLSWRRWFEAHKVTPFQVTYEDLTTDAEAIVQSIVEFLDVQNDEPDQVNVPPARKQSDETNQGWIERFLRESTAGQDGREVGPSVAKNKVATKGASLQPEHFSDRYEHLIKRLSEEVNSATGFVDMIRLRHRYNAIIGQNRELFQNACVLDIMSSYGFWSLAALDAGAAKVVGVESSPVLVDAGAKNLAEQAIDPGRYQFIKSDVFAALDTFRPRQFDVILCKGFFEQCHFPRFFRQLSRLQPAHVVLDTRITRGQGPLARFAIATGRTRTIISIPNPELIAFLCEAEFRWRLVDWHAMGISNWTGIQDYARDTHRTYVLDRVAS
jgi:LPS sulfotransferase NodH/pimeloyl-ACP methyl ester carboxylesterase